MANDDDARTGQTFSTKEMLIRLDGKLDSVLARQQNYDIELALLKARADGLELADHNRSRDAEKWREEVKRETEKWRDTTDRELESLRADLETLGRRHAYQAGGLAALVVAANIAVPFILHFVR